LWKLVRFLHVPGRIDRVKKQRALFTAVGAGAIILAVVGIPLPYHVRCAFYLQPRDAAAVYVESPGILSRIAAHPGDYVAAGQPLVQLENLDVAIEIEQLRGERQRLESRLDSLRQRAFDDEQAAGEVGEVEQMLAATDEQIAARESDLRKLTVTAPASGIVIPPPLTPAASPESGRLPAWSGTPFDNRNLRAYLAEGVSVCQVGDPNQLEAILMIDERDVEFLHPGQDVELFLEQLPGQRFRCRIEQLSQADIERTPASLSSKTGGDVLSRVDSAGRERPLNTTYQANALLTDESGMMLVGATGEGKIHARPRTLAQRVWRYLRQTFHFDV
jgi:multidrug efflux pump subunit AcrA (membrane-fusion protein)